MSAAGAASAATPARIEGEKAALLGGKPVKPDAFPGWPVEDASDENELLGVMRGGKWGRLNGPETAKFEQQFAALMGARYCLGVSSGTAALLTTLGALGIGPGDEVIVPPYTFIATVNVVLMSYGLPVFVDTDPETFQIDAGKIEAAITDRTRAIIAVHLGGATFDVDAVQAIAKKHNLPLIEDSCQSHLAAWRGHPIGSFGTAGCFSFQSSKNLNCGEGGAILTASDDFLDQCFAFHNNGRGRKQPSNDPAYRSHGINLRMTEFQASVLVTQMARVEQQARTRTDNAAYLTGLLQEIPGIAPARTYAGCTRNAYHLYMFRYDAARFSGLPRAKFLKAMRAEGIPCSGGYAPLNKEPFLANTFATSGYQAIYPKERIARWHEQNQTLQNEKLCSEAVWFTQTMLLGQRRDMDQIAEAVRKIQRQAAELNKV